MTATRSTQPLSRKSCLILFSSIYWSITTASSTPLDVLELLRSNANAVCPLELDDAAEAQSSNWKPWTHRPYCVDTVSGTVPKYCVYSNNNFGENGISVITTPDIATSNAGFLQDNPMSLFVSPKVAAKWTTNRPYKVIDIPGKGKGVVATRLIPKYETFMLDTAAVAFNDAIEGSVNRLQAQLLLRHATDRLVDPNKIMSLDQSNKAGHDVMDDIMLTNAFHTDLSGVPHRALFPKVSRINHGCDPNAFVMFSPSGLSVAINAYRDIQPGEEIVVSYLDLGKTFKERQSELKPRWGFTCTCNMCTAPAKEIKASDDRRKRAKDMSIELAELLKTGNFQKSIKLAKDALKLLETERLTAMATEHYITLARIYLALGIRHKADEYGDLAVELLKNHGFLGRGDDHWTLEDLLRVFGIAEDGRG